MSGADTTKRCSRCRKVKTVDMFYRRHDRPGGRQSHCKTCDQDRRVEVRRAHPEWDLTAGLYWRHRIRVEDYETMLAAQGGGCAVCGTTDLGDRARLDVDHDHDCCPDTRRSCGNCIRGLLCNRCNTGIGQFKDDPERLRRAADYLEKARGGDCYSSSTLATAG